MAKSLRSILENFGSDFVSDLGKSLDRRKDASRDLRKSIKFRLRLQGDYFNFNLMMEDYYKWVDEGRKAGKGAPLGVIDGWLKNPAVISKLGLYSNKKLTSGKGLKKKLNANSYVNSLSFLINRKIKTKGIKPTYFFTNVFEDGRVERLKKELVDYLKQDVILTIRE